MLYFVICDDNENHNVFMEKWLNRVFHKHNFDGKISLVANRAETVLAYSKKYYDRINVYILDIDFKDKLSGIELAREIRQEDRMSYIVFITAHEEHCMRSFKLKTFDYLLKPVTSAMIEKFIVALYDDYKRMSTFEKKVPIKSGSSIFMTNVNDIIYFEKNRQVLITHLKNGVLRSYEPLKNVAEDLSSYGFFQCHRSFIVNRRHVEKISLKEKCIYMSNGKKCFFSKRYRKEVLEYFSDIL